MRIIFCIIAFALIQQIMATHTIIINDKTNKTNFLLGLIKEIAKNEKYIIIDPIPNKETKKAVEDVRKGKLFSVKNSKDLFEQLER